MTNEQIQQAIESLGESKRQAEVMFANPTLFFTARTMVEQMENTGKRIVCLDTALAVLRKELDRAERCNKCEGMEFINIRAGKTILKCPCPLGRTELEGGQHE